MFYFWNVNELVKDLRAGIVTEYDKMKYLLVTSLLQLYALYFTAQYRYIPTNKIELLVKALFFGVEVGVIVWGIHHCYIINKHNDDKNFIERFVCLSLPVSIRLLVYFLVGAFIGLLVIAFGIALLNTFSQTATAASNVTVTITPDIKVFIKEALHKDLFRKRIISHVVSVVIAIIYFIFLGRKIDAVGASELQKKKYN